jgi:hypothetical protein
LLASWKILFANFKGKFDNLIDKSSNAVINNTTSIIPKNLSPSSLEILKKIDDIDSVTKSNLNPVLLLAINYLSSIDKEKYFAKPVDS